MDFAGPFITVQGRGRRREKRYLCLFTCLQSRAVHLEMAYGLDTDVFLRALSRFIGRRGKPSVMISDNGTNFVGATGEIEEIVLDTYGMRRFVADNGIRWILNPPMGHHLGGEFEALVKSAKRAINAVLKNADVNDEELETVMIRAEEMINSRPLTVQSKDEKGMEVLTPNHFLYARWHGFDPGGEALNSKGSNLATRWRRVQEIQKHIWRRWMEELVPSWAPRSKWRKEEENLKIGQIVWVLDKGTEVGRWPLGRITELLAGTDQRIRVLRLMVDGKVLTRPISRVFPLECEDDPGGRTSGGDWGW